MKSRDRIISAAIPVFAKKGRHGAHMEEIASTAHMNKAMIYYIFHNKDELYFEVLKYIIDQAYMFMYDSTWGEIHNSMDYRNQISSVISSMITFFSDNKNFTKIIVDAMSNGSEEIPCVVQQVKDLHEGNDPLKSMRLLISNGKKEKIFRDIDTDQLIISIIGMVLIYYISGSISEIFDIQITDEKEFQEARRLHIIDLVLNSIILTKKQVR